MEGCLQLIRERLLSNPLTPTSRSFMKTLRKAGLRIEPLWNRTRISSSHILWHGYPAVGRTFYPEGSWEIRYLKLFWSPEWLYQLAFLDQLSDLPCCRRKTCPTSRTLPTWKQRSQRLCCLLGVLQYCPVFSFSMILPDTKVRLTGLQSPGSSFLPFLEMKTMFTIFQSTETSLYSQDIKIIVRS